MNIKNFIKDNIKPSNNKDSNNDLIENPYVEMNKNNYSGLISKGTNTNGDGFLAICKLRFWQVC